MQQSDTATTINIINEPWNISLWLEELNKRLEVNDSDSLRSLFRSILTYFPSSAAIWYSWAQYEWRNDNYEQLEKLFAEALRPWGDVRLWKLYLQYVRSCNVSVDSDDMESIQTKRQTILKSYELAISHIGVDFYSSFIYRDYVKFIESWKCNTLYEQQVQMDYIRKVYNRALVTPLDAIEVLWHEYDTYENNLNKLTAKKILADKSPAYMAARSASKELKEILSYLERDEYALPPPLDINQAAWKVSIWQRWVDWEKGNPLKIPDKTALFIQRVQYAYKSMLSVLRHYSEVWFEYSRWLSYVGRKEEAESVLKTAIEILPRDLLINFAYCHNLESADPESGKPIEAKAIFERLISSFQADLENCQVDNDGNLPVEAEETRQNLTLVFIQLMNYCRRIEGITAARAIFTRARQQAFLTFHIFLAAAKMEYYCKKDSIIAGKIFELGMSKFSSSGEYVLEYLNHLIALNDEQNARALFERAILSVPLGPSAIEIWKTYLDFIFRYGDLGSVALLSKRFQEAYPDQLVSKDITIFCRQYSYDDTSVGNERTWILLQGQALPPHVPDRKLPKPFFVSEMIEDLIGKLPLSQNFDGPRINPEGVVRILQVLRLFPDITTPLVPGAATKKPSTVKVPRSSTKMTNKPNRKRQKNRLDDGDNTPEAVQTAIRSDDIFALRRKNRVTPK